jgi:hypothetical protein
VFVQKFLHDHIDRALIFRDRSFFVRDCDMWVTNSRTYNIQVQFQIQKGFIDNKIYIIHEMFGHRYDQTSLPSHPYKIKRKIKLYKVKTNHNKHI